MTKTITIQLSSEEAELLQFACRAAAEIAQEHDRKETVGKLESIHFRLDNELCYNRSAA